MRSNIAHCCKASPSEQRDSAEREARARFILTRQARGWTQLQTSMRLGVARSAVENWERGETRIPAWALLIVEKGKP